MQAQIVKTTFNVLPFESLPKAEEFAKGIHVLFVEKMQNSNYATFEIVAPERADFSLRCAYLKHIRTEYTSNVEGGGNVVYHRIFVSEALITMEVINNKTKEVCMHYFLPQSSGEIDTYQYDSKMTATAVKAKATKIADLELSIRTVNNMVAAVVGLSDMKLQAKEVLKQDEKKISRILLNGGRYFDLAKYKKMYAYTPSKDTLQGKIINSRAFIAESEQMDEVERETTVLNFKGKDATALKKAVDSNVPVYYTLNLHKMNLEKWKEQSVLEKEIVYLAKTQNNAAAFNEPLKCLDHIIRANAFDQFRLRFVQDETKEVLSESQVITNAQQAGAKYVLLPILKTYIEGFEENFWFSIPEITFKVIEVATRKVLAEPDNNVHKYESKAISSLVDVFKQVEISLGAVVTDVLLRAIPPTISIKSVVEKTKKGKAEKILIDIGYNAGLQNKTLVGLNRNMPIGAIRFKVYEVIEGTGMNQKIAENHVGVVEVADIENDHTTICKIKKNGEGITRSISEGKKLAFRVYKDYFLNADADTDKD